MRLIFHAKTIENEDSLELLAKSKRGTPTIYIIDSTITIPNQKENEEVKVEKDQVKEENKKPEEPKVRMIKKRVSKRKQARIREEFMKKLELPKSLFLTSSLFYFSIFLFFIQSSLTNWSLMWIINFFIIIYYREVKENIKEYYIKIMREHNIQYDSELTIETKKREEIVKNRIHEMKNSSRWDSENYTHRYGFFESIILLIYYFFMSFFPGYIEKKLDIFQREHNLLQAEMRIRNKQREFEAKLKQKQEELAKQAKQAFIQNMEEEPKFGPEIIAQNSKPSEIFGQSHLDADPIIEDE